MDNCIYTGPNWTVIASRLPHYLTSPALTVRRHLPSLSVPLHRGCRCLYIWVCSPPHVSHNSVFPFYLSSHFTSSFSIWNYFSVILFYLRLSLAPVPVVNTACLVIQNLLMLNMSSDSQLCTCQTWQWLQEWFWKQTDISYFMMRSQCKENIL